MQKLSFEVRSAGHAEKELAQLLIAGAVSCIGVDLTQHVFFAF
jgi:hypothetical protein